MKKFKVTVKNANGAGVYEIEAPDRNTAEAEAKTRHKMHTRSRSEVSVVNAFFARLFSPSSNLCKDCSHLDFDMTKNADFCGKLKTVLSKRVTNCQYFG